MDPNNDILAAENLPVVTMTEEVQPTPAPQETTPPVQQEVVKKLVETPEPIKQTEPTVVEDESEPIKLDDFLKVKDGSLDQAEPAPKKELPKARDYSGLAEDEIPLFKQMSNEAFAKLKTSYLESKALKLEVEKLKNQPKTNTIPDSYLEHEKAVTLTPEYEEASQKLQLATDIVQHWENQLANIRRGKDWQNLVVDQKTGVISVDPTPKKADAQSEAAVNRYLTLTANQQFRVQEQFNQFVGSFKARRESALSFVKDQEKKYFGAFDDEKHPARPLVEEVKNKLPAEFRNSPLAPMLAKSLVACLYLEKKVNELQSAQQKKVIIAGDARKAGPTMSSINGVAAGKDDADVTFDDFIKLKNGGF